MPFDIRDLNILDFGICGVLETTPPTDTKGWTIPHPRNCREKVCPHFHHFSIPMFSVLTFPVKVNVQRQGLFYTQAKPTATWMGLQGPGEAPKISTHPAVLLNAFCEKVARSTHGGSSFIVRGSGD